MHLGIKFFVGRTLWLAALVVIMSTGCQTAQGPKHGATLMKDPQQVDECIADWGEVFVDVLYVISAFR